MSQFLSVVMKVTSRCNLDCVYCYEKSVRSDLDCTADSIDTLLDSILSTTRSHIYFTWHGGEPLLLGPEFYRRAFMRQREYPTKHVGNSVQSNLLLLNRDFIKLFKEFGVNIGTSVDGPPRINDALRICSQVETMTDALEKEIRLLVDNGMAPRAVCVISRRNIGEIASVYRYFEDLGIGFTMKPIVPNPSYSELNITSREYGKALIEMFDYWFQNKRSRLTISPFSQILNTIESGICSYCLFSGRCLEEFVNVWPDGSVYPTCNRFPYEQRLIGNMKSGSMDRIHNASSMRKAVDLRRAALDQNCQDCEFYKFLCNGGCPNSYAGGDITAKDFYCDAYKMLFFHIMQRLRGK